MIQATQGSRPGLPLCRASGATATLVLAEVD